MKNIWITNAKHVKDFSIELIFNDGVKGTINLARFLTAPVFKPLTNIEYFKSFKLNKWTIEWENGADFAPEFLYEQVKSQQQISV